jgi:N-acetylmuramic acid 6-phosphate etherase
MVEVDILLILNTGPEILTGSTRMKAGTATKMVLNMISTTTMIKLGKVYRNLMVDLMAVNKKLCDRGVRIISQVAGVNKSKASKLLINANYSVKCAIVMSYLKCSLHEAKIKLKSSNGFLSKVLNE